MNASNQQVGGSHYTALKIQPVELIIQLNCNFFVGNVVKYVSRHRRKNKAEDIRKAMHFVQLAKEHDVQQVWVADSSKLMLQYKDANKLIGVEADAIYSMYLNEWERATECLCNILRFVYPCNVQECLFYDKGTCLANTYESNECNATK